MVVPIPEVVVSTEILHYIALQRCVIEGCMDLSALLDEDDEP